MIIKAPVCEENRIFFCISHRNRGCIIEGNSLRGTIERACIIEMPATLNGGRGLHDLAQFAFVQPMFHRDYALSLHPSLPN